MSQETEPTYYSIRQVAELTRRSYQTVKRYCAKGKIASITVDYFTIIPTSEIKTVAKVGGRRRQTNTLDGYVTVIQAARTIGIDSKKLKKYVKENRIEHVVDLDGIYFIPDKVVEQWCKLAVPSPNNVEAESMGCRTIQDAALALGCSDSSIRGMIAEGVLKTKQGYNRKYVTKESILENQSIHQLARDIL